MTGRLLKYELKSSYQYMLIVWGAMILASIGIALVPVIPGDDTMFISNLLRMIPFLLYGAAVIALIVAMVFVVVIRFYKGLMCEEGYLMHTLPVKEWQLIVSKALAATIFILVSLLVVIISAIIFVIGAEGISQAIHDLGYLISQIKLNAAAFKIFIIIIECLILVIFGILKSLYQVYASLAIGQLVDKYRILLAIGAYIGISVALTVIGAVGIEIGDLILSDKFMAYWNINPFESAHEFFYLQILLIFCFVVELVQVVVFHIVTERILTKKLNLL